MIETSDNAHTVAQAMCRRCVRARNLTHTTLTNTVVIASAQNTIPKAAPPNPNQHLTTNTVFMASPQILFPKLVAPCNRSATLTASPTYHISNSLLQFWTTLMGTMHMTVRAAVCFRNTQMKQMSWNVFPAPMTCDSTARNPSLQAAARVVDGRVSSFFVERQCV